MARRGRGNIVFDVPEEEKKNEISYLQPEILPVNIMEDILRQKGFSTALLSKADRKQLIKYFYKHISPKFQRDYRENRRGKILKKMRARHERKIEEDWQSMIMNSKGKTSSSHYSSSSRDRLKPPPSSYKSKNFDDIVIKDHKVRSRPSEEKASKSLDQVIIKDHKPRSGEDRDRKNESEKRSHDHHSDSSHKKIRLSPSEKRPSDSESTNSGKKVKLHRTAVAWP